MKPTINPSKIANAVCKKSGYGIFLPRLAGILQEEIAASAFYNFFDTILYITSRVFAPRAGQ